MTPHVRVPAIVVDSKILLANILKVLTLTRHKEVPACIVNLFTGFSYFSCFRTKKAPQVSDLGCPIKLTLRPPLEHENSIYFFDEP